MFDIGTFLLGFCLGCVVYSIIIAIRDFRQLDREFDQRIEEIRSAPSYSKILTEHKLKLCNQVEEFCTLCGIPIEYTDKELIGKDGTRSSAQIIETITYYPSDIDLDFPYEQEIRKDGYRVRDKILVNTSHAENNQWLLLHELGHWIAFRRGEESTEERADQYGAKLCRILLTEDEYEFLKEYIKIWFHQDNDEEKENENDIEGSEYHETWDA